MLRCFIVSKRPSQVTLTSCHPSDIFLDPLKEANHVDCNEPPAPTSNKTEK